ncbi:MAG: aldo/keto reductase [Bacteroidota bacterium]
MQHVTLNDGHIMPVLGLGVYLSKDGQEVINAIHWALDAGYRHIDTAKIYKNEEGVGQAIQSAAVPREDIFLTTKIWNDDIRAGNTQQALETSLRKLDTDYVDLLLLHWPVDGSAAAWEVLERAKEKGQVKSIGVSNFMPEHLDDLLHGASTVPAVNQIEYHPYNQQRDVLAACAAKDIVVTAWSPLMQGKFKEVPLLEEIGRRYGKSAVQVLLRWDLQTGVTTIPKSVNQQRIKANFDIFDFELSAAEVTQITALERGERVGPDPRDFSF